MEPILLGDGCDFRYQYSPTIPQDSIFSINSIIFKLENQFNYKAHMELNDYSDRKFDGFITGL
jgi:hypothetical protein